MVKRKTYVGMHSHFDTNQEPLMERLRVMKDIIAEQTLADSPCPLLASQLDELQIFGEKMVSLAHKLRESLEELNHAD